MRQWMHDIVLFFHITVFLTKLMANCWWLTWLMLGGVLCNAWLFPRQVEANWLNWFEITKFIAALCCIVTISLWQCQSVAVTSESWHYLCSILLMINILEAVICDIQRGIIYYPNAICGLVLILKMPLFEPVETDHGLLPHPLSWQWVMAYNCWNAVFTYGYNLAWSTRAQLITTMIVLADQYQNNPIYWLHIRTLTLTLNMILRAIRLNHLFTPGESWLSHNTTFRANVKIYAVCGMVNFAFCVLYVAKSIDEYSRMIVMGSRFNKDQLF